MNKKNILEILEQRYKKNHEEMDKENDKAEQAKKEKREAETYQNMIFAEHQYNEARRKAGAFAAVACELVEIMAEINGTSFDSENERLYNKFNLWKK